MDHPSKVLEQVFNHIALPARLPGCSDSNAGDVNSEIISRAIQGVDRLCAFDHPASRDIYPDVKRSLEHCASSHEDGQIDKAQLLQAFADVPHGTSLMVHIAAQNAGLLIVPVSDAENENCTEHVRFECFEASASASSVLACTGALTCEYPGSAAMIPIEVFNNTSFQESLAGFLEQASGEVIEAFAAQAKKAGTQVIERRDTAAPSMISQLLMVFLEAHGSAIAPQRIRKRVRDDVCWSDAYLPWRRSPLYLVIRVGVQRMLYASNGPDAGRLYYKLFVCMLHFQLLVDVELILPLESRHFLLVKLCRRLAKLEGMRNEMKLPVLIGQLHDICTRTLSNGVENAMKGLEAEWIRFKWSIQKKIPNFPARAMEDDTRLQLPNSGLPIAMMLAAKGKKAKAVSPSKTTGHNLDERINQLYRKFAMKYNDLYGLENRRQRELVNPQSDLTVLLSGVESYLSSMTELFDTSAEERSIMMLSLFEYWVRLDQQMVEQFPLLEEYSCGFPPAVLDVLQLASYADMERLRRVQEWLHTRQERCRFKQQTIFSPPVPDGFSDRYVQNSPDAPQLESLRETIEAASRAAQIAKEDELTRINRRYRELSRQIESLQCTRQKKEKWSSCAHCQAKRARKKLVIMVHEDLLPKDCVQQRAVLFELGMPPTLARYRDTTWKIIAAFGIPERALLAAPASPAKAVLGGYTPLQRYMKHPGLRFQMASKAKSFLVSHYKGSALPVSAKQVLLPFGLVLECYDTETDKWASDLLGNITFAHNFSLNKSTLALLSRGEEFAAGGDGRSSYEILVRQEECPGELTVHEYTTFQTLLTAKLSRWLSLLRELGSSNLNFSLESTMYLVSYMALQAGPITNGKTLRDIHQVLEDTSFCFQLASQIDTILSRICGSWREAYCMETLLTLILRICNLGPELAKKRGIELLHRARLISVDWCRKLRIEIQSAVASDKAQQLSTYALLAGMLCKRTFAISKTLLYKWEDLQIFLEACLTIQENIEDPSQLAPPIRGMFIRDLRLTSSMSTGILEALTRQQPCMWDAIGESWPDEPDGHRRECCWNLVKGSLWWRQASIPATAHTQAQKVQYHPLEGHLLVDQTPIGKLPSAIRDSPVVQDLFGQERLMVHPSAMKDMNYTLVGLRQGHRVHFGKIKDEIVVQALVRGSRLRLVDRRYFGTGPRADLPFNLISDCFHWLDMVSREVDIRRRKHMWMFRRTGNWVLDMRTRLASRGTVLLVDPHSKLFGQVASVFQGFEEVERLTVFQPSLRNLSVELKRMDLDFIVNRRGHLLCRQLHAEVDPDQDAGMWYGLQGGIVLRDSAHHLNRSIVVPIGPVSSMRLGPHVQVNTDLSSGKYGRYQIDDVLGRLKCEPDPLLMYTKSLLHAFTSCPLPDGLTQRTGTEEALASLTSAMSQPWTAIGPNQAQPLIALAQLTPTRYYYPESKKTQQQVLWSEGLTATIQDERYRPLVEKMVRRFDSLAEFWLQDGYRLRLDQGGAMHLTQRSYLRQKKFMRPEYVGDLGADARDKVYSGRDTYVKGAMPSQVYEIARILQQGTAQSATTTSLAEKFDHATWISGYTQPYHPDSLSDSLGVDLVSEWGRLVNLCRQYRVGRYDIALRLAIIAFRDNIDMDLLRSLAAFCVVPALQDLHLPQNLGYSSIKLNEVPSQESVLILVKHGCGTPSEGYNAARMKNGIPNFKTLSQYTELFEAECCAIANSIRKQWPRMKIRPPQISCQSIDLNKIISKVQPEWARLVENFDFLNSLGDIQAVLNMHTSTLMPPSRPQLRTGLHVYPTYSYKYVIPDLSTLLAGSARGERLSALGAQGLALDPWHADTDRSIATRCQDTTQHYDAKAAGLAKIETIVKELSRSQSALRRKYGENLSSSLSAFQRVLREEHSIGNVAMSNIPKSMISNAREKANRQFMAICASLSKSDARYRWLSLAQLWPCLTPVTLLQQLRTSAQRRFGPRIKESLIAYGVLLTRLQQLIRIYDAVRKEDSHRLRSEYENPGHENWNPEDFPDWLLMEIDANILIRKTQVDVARATIMPASKSNSVLQMNMGQGKTSVVTPMVLCALADGKTLVRLVVPESLLLQTAQMIQSRLGDLVGREILHIPFARRSPTLPDSICKYRAFHEETLQRYGIMLTVPQHVLSFRLNGFQCLEDYRFESAGAIFSTQSWMADVCRDVIDECDFSLAVKTQLIYPSGSQALVDGHPQRWKIAHLLLGMVQRLALELHSLFPSSVNVVQRAGGVFPFIHILRPDVEDQLLHMLVDELCSERSPILASCRTCDWQTLKRFILHTDKGDVIEDTVCTNFENEQTSLKTLFLLRGLIGQGIILVCLKKRWNVQYGLHRARSPIAVPFLAKGVPSEQSEWGHPDVAIVLTCLAFYYDGLSVEQLHQCLHSLSQTDDPSTRYSQWVAYSETMPVRLRHWNLVNVDDRLQMQDIWPYLRYNMAIINFFLDTYVFPQHAKQFSTRLQMSGWDLPLFDLGYGKQCSRLGSSHRLTTGFSGTNDDRFLLPLTIQQNDLPALSHTNAEVLSYLLEKRNESYMVATADNGNRFSEVDLLRRLHKMKIRTLIDAGAHILELENRDLVREWLAIDYQAPAAVYFDANNKPWVMDRNETEVPLLASSFANSLGECLVYLDEAHTRGTDLKFPPSTRGALTLSLGQTKDHTVQAAMRLRELGASQSVIFVASPEAHQDILAHREKTHGDTIDSSDIVSWLVEQTCRHQEQLQSLYLAQGNDFCRRIDAESSYCRFLTDPKHRTALLAAIRQQEQHEVKEMYGTRPISQKLTGHTFKPSRIAGFMAALDQLKANSGNVQAISIFAFAEVEQEREMMTEIEQVRELQRPTPLHPRTFPGLHGSIKEFALHGHLQGQHGYEAAFRALQRTAAGRKYGVYGSQKSRLFVSTEFTKSADIKPREWLVDFLRPVHWILWSPATETALILTLEEAECVLPLIMGGQATATHLLIYAAPFTKGMLHFSQLDYYALPALPQDQRLPTTLLIELGIVAGTLYCTYTQYQAIKRYLEDETGSGIPNAATGRAVAVARDTLGFLSEWLSMTRKGQEFSHTPMGYICRSQGLYKGHPLFIPV
ncbi:hypothetical protein BJY01DRAFT_255875 [Aspergillus pseudoustus]|uniref:ubiquitinyl hydrolase 1 n=1 Tax=Aspergillus pseudoustus TaxID=1810923 RepID=A0ABR4IGK6_9EURO